MSQLRRELSYEVYKCIVSNDKHSFERFVKL